MIGFNKNTMIGLTQTFLWRNSTLYGLIQHLTWHTKHWKDHMTSTKPLRHDFAALTSTSCVYATRKTCKSHIPPRQSSSIVCELGRICHDCTDRRMDKWVSNHTPTSVCHWLHTELFKLGHEPIFTCSCVSVTSTSDNDRNIRTLDSSLAKLTEHGHLLVRKVRVTERDKVDLRFCRFV